jgi:hypothetical protein
LATTAAITNLAAGSYTVKVTNRTSTCSGTRVVSISNNAFKPSLALAKSDNSSCDASVYLGTLKATFASNPNDPTGNLNTYVYTWRQTLPAGSPAIAATGNQIIGLKGGTYEVFVEDKTLNCISDPVSQAINNSPVPPTISVAQTGSTNCPGGAANGRVTLTVFSPNSEAPDQIGYEWYVGKTATGTPIPGETSRILDRQQGGSNNFFTVKVTSEISSCENTATVLLQDVSAAPVLTLNTATNTICTPLVSPLNYNGSVSKNRLTDNNRVSTDTYTYNWYNGTGTATPNPTTPTTTGQTFSGSTALNNLNGGQQYTVTVLNDRLKCLSNPVTVTVNNNLILPDLTVAPAPNTRCADGLGFNGTAQVNVNNPSSGTDDFSYVWTGAGGTGTNVEDAPHQNIVSVVSNLQAGNNYRVTVTRKATGCVNTATQNIADNSALPVLSLATTANSICALGGLITDFNGSITGTTTDRNRKSGQTFTYAITGGPSAGTDTRTASGSPVTIPNGALPKLNAGSYTVTVKNNSLGCTSNPVTATVADATVLPTITMSSVPSTNCDPLLKNGSVTVTSPTTGSTYAWFDGLTTASPVLPSTSTTASAMQGGAGKNYTVQVTTSATNCKKTSTLLLADNSSKPIIALTTTPNSVCGAPAAFNGTVRATVTTDTNQKNGHIYSYAWFDGATTASPAIPPPTASTFPTVTSTLGGRKAGSYTVTVTNTALGCIANAVTAAVLDNITLPVLTTTVLNEQKACAGGNPSGQLRVATTGTGQWEYNWYRGIGTSGAVVSTSGGPVATNQNSTTLTPTGLTSDNYTAQVKDNSTGCTSR